MRNELLEQNIGDFNPNYMKSHNWGNIFKPHEHVALLNETIVYDGVTLFRIIAISDFKNAKRGDIGGYVESLSNISKEAWIADNAKVYGEAMITDKAVACGNAIIKDQAVVSKHAQISENATVKDTAKIFGWAKISGNSVVCKMGQVSQFATVSGNAEVRGFVYGHSILTCHAFVEEYKQVPGLAA